MRLRCSILQPKKNDDYLIPKQSLRIWVSLLFLQQKMKESSYWYKKIIMKKSNQFTLERKGKRGQAKAYICQWTYLYGTWPFFLLRDAITSPRAERDRFMALPSSRVSPVAPVFKTRSLPPRSTIHSLLVSALAFESRVWDMVILVKLDRQS